MLTPMVAAMLELPVDSVDLEPMGSSPWSTATGQWVAVAFESCSRSATLCSDASVPP